MPPKIRTIKIRKFFNGTSLSQKERTQSWYPSWILFNNGSSFYDGNWISIHCVSRLPLALHHLSNSWVPYFFYIWCPRMHDSLRSSSMIFHVVSNSSNLFSRLEFIGVFNFWTDARTQKYFYLKIFYTKIFGFAVDVVCTCMFFCTPWLCFLEDCSYTLCTGGDFEPTPSLTKKYSCTSWCVCVCMCLCLHTTIWWQPQVAV